MNPAIVIRPMQTEEEGRTCAAAMAASEPWITLRRGFDHALAGFRDANRESHVALVGGDLAGVVKVNLQGPFAGYVQVLLVLPAWRGRGVGTQLMAFAEERIFRESPNVFLLVSSFNPRAQRFYSRLGYERIGELRDYVIAGAAEILMRKTLGPKEDFRGGFNRPH